MVAQTALEEFLQQVVDLGETDVEASFDPMKLLQETSGGVSGLLECILDAARNLGISCSSTKINTFCLHTPGGAQGSELWEEFENRRSSARHASQREYTFTDFMREVLRDAGEAAPSPSEAS